MGNYKILKPCVIKGESRKPAKGKKGEVELDAKTARPLVRSGKLEDLNAKEENLELTLNIDPKELEEIKAKLAAKDEEIKTLTEAVAAKDEEIKTLTEKVAALEASDGKGK